MLMPLPPAAVCTVVLSRLTPLPARLVPWVAWVLAPVIVMVGAVRVVGVATLVPTSTPLSLALLVVPVMVRLPVAERLEPLLARYTPPSLAALPTRVIWVPLICDGWPALLVICTP